MPDKWLGEWTRLELTKLSETSTPSRLLDFSCFKSHLITLTGDNSFNSLKIPRRTCNREDPMPELLCLRAYVYSNQRIAVSKRMRYVLLSLCR